MGARIRPRAPTLLACLGCCGPDPQFGVGIGGGEGLHEALNVGHERLQVSAHSLHVLAFLKDRNAETVSAYTTLAEM